MTLEHEGKRCLAHTPVRYSFAMVAFCYCLSFAFDKAETSYAFSGNILNFAFLIPSLVVSFGSTTGPRFPAIYPRVCCATPSI
jgi:hypothetical protein